MNMFIKADIPAAIAPTIAPVLKSNPVTAQPASPACMKVLRARISKALPDIYFSLLNIAISLSTNALRIPTSLSKRPWS